MRAALLALVAFAALLPGEARAAQSACPDVVFIGARGSGEPAVKRTRGMGPSVHRMAERMRKNVEAAGERMSTLPVVYEAASTDMLEPSRKALAAMAAMGAAGAAAHYDRRYLRRYLKSLDGGTALTKQAIRTTASGCPDADIVLAGYSQGAMAVTQAHHQLVEAGDESALDAIAGVLLLASGDRSPNSAARRFGSSPARGQGIRPYLSAVRRRDVADPEITAHICDAGDLICDFSVKRVLSGRRAGRAIATHTGYLDRDGGKLLDRAVDWLAGELGLAAGTAVAATTVRRCGDIAFSPNSENGVYDIRARGASCRLARRVARASRPHSITRGPYRYTARGFACRGRLDDTTLPVVRWTCTRGSRRVTFERA